jgi:hypothetical protein
MTFPGPTHEEAGTEIYAHRVISQDSLKAIPRCCHPGAFLSLLYGCIISTLGLRFGSLFYVVFVLFTIDLKNSRFVRFAYTRFERL